MMNDVTIKPSIQVSLTSFFQSTFSIIWLGLALKCKHLCKVHMFYTQVLYVNHFKCIMPHEYTRYTERSKCFTLYICNSDQLAKLLNVKTNAVKIYFFSKFKPDCLLITVNLNDSFWLDSNSMNCPLRVITSYKIIIQ